MSLPDKAYYLKISILDMVNSIIGTYDNRILLIEEYH